MGHYICRRQLCQLADVAAVAVADVAADAASDAVAAAAAAADVAAAALSASVDARVYQTQRNISCILSQRVCGCT